MEGQQRLRATFERNKKAVSLRPTVGQQTIVSKVKIRENLTCDVEDGRWKLTADMGEKSGGYGAGPDPGVFGRAALGSCLAMGYVIWAANLDVPISGVEVEVHVDADVRGRYDLADVPMGYKEIRFLVKVESEAPEEDIMRVIDEADAHSPYLEVFSQPMRIQREVRIGAKQGQ
jgi:uncharacterized OsmC-like protein